MDKLQAIPVWLLILLAVLLLAQSTWLFLDARKRTRFYWIWALWGLTQIPTPSFVYIVFFRLRLWQKLFHRANK
ncbi:sigmaY antisigma factor component [Paenibacillus yanchengensis]|uniref:SigmaY antisigma factor component n=1 Tax=Paenibacillus yanchengensis TaxID=2035833 RepID=A0ABW4YJT3_9BACL